MGSNAGGFGFLSGMAQGVGEEYSKQGEEKRQAKIQNDRLLAESINQRLANDTSLDWPSYSSLRAQEYKLRGLPDADAQNLLGHEKDLWTAAQRQASTKAQAATPNTPLPTPPDVSSPGAATVGGTKQTLTAPTTVAAGQTTGEAAGAGAVPQAIAQVQSKVGQFKTLYSRDPTPDELDQIKREVITPTQTKLPISINKNNKITSDQAITSGYTNYIDGTPIEQGEFAIPVLHGAQIAGYTKYLEPNKTSNWFQSPDSKTGWAKENQDEYGNPTGIIKDVQPPPGYLQRKSEFQTYQIRVNPATGQLEKIPVTSSRTSTPVLGGAQPTQPSATPGAPGSPAPAPAGKITPLAPLPAAPAARAIPKSPAGEGKLGIPNGPAGVIDDPGGAPRTTLPPSADPLVSYLTGQVASGRMKLSDVKGDGVAKTDKQVRGAVQSNLAALGLDVNKATTEQFNTATFAKSVLDEYPRIETLLAQASQDGKLGIAASRFNEFMAGKVGAGDDEFTKLRLDVGLIQSALMKIHTGARGSTTILQKFGGLINGGITDAQTLKSQLEEAKSWIQNYSQLVPTGEEALQGGGPGGRGGRSTPATSIPGTLPTVTTQEQFNALPKGAMYLEDGVKYQKP